MVDLLVHSCVSEGPLRDMLGTVGFTLAGGKASSKMQELMSRWDKIDDLSLSGNPWESPPVPVVAKGIDAVKKYYEELEQTAAVLVDSRKVVLIGHGGAGKTRCAIQPCMCYKRGLPSPWRTLPSRAMIPSADPTLVVPCFGHSISKFTADG